MIKYPKDYNPILEYWELIKSGEEVVSRKVYKTYQKVASDLANEKGEFFYSNSRANHVIEFFENFCRHSKGKMGGRPVILELWEKAFLATVFGFINIEGYRQYQEALLIVGKKNGKSLIASGVGLYMLVGDGEPGPEVYAVATKRDQAKIIWSEARRMVRKSPTLKRKIKTLVAELNSEDFNDGTFKALASDSDSLDGLNIHCSLMDELQQWKNGKPLYDIIADGTTAREQPLNLISTTAGSIREDIYDQKYDEYTNIINGYGDPDGYKDDRRIGFIYELDNRKEWIDPSCWKKANPGLGTIKNLKTLQQKVERAQKNPLLVKNLVCKEFNIRETSTEAWLTYEQIDNQATFDIKQLKPRYGIGGSDLSETTDLTCATVIFKVPNDEKIYVIQMYWLPEDLLEQRAREDKIPYDTWRDLGLLKTTPGNKVHYKFVTEWFDEIRKELDIYVPWMGTDRWSADYFKEEMRALLGKEAVEDVAQGKPTLSGPMKRLGADLEAKRIIYNNHPILKWCMTNVAIDVDKNLNIQPCKTQNQRRRIDGFSSLLDAYVALERHAEDYDNLI